MRSGFEAAVCCLQRAWTFWEPSTCSQMEKGGSARQKANQKGEEDPSPGSSKTAGLIGYTGQ